MWDALVPPRWLTFRELPPPRAVNDRTAAPAFTLCCRTALHLSAAMLGLEGQERSAPAFARVGQRACPLTSG
eukprot:4497591-Pyramimonas_sp.AAC.1